ncbi:malonate decarboxylase subunit alpha [Paraburkholderia silvatlantica]|uniref:Malonate decarboxylase alpha subunit n=1 Tax=Paraburkholderia silvatlantica TaxID=321895 RepID=A0A2U1ABS0_9BURK|nr:malonate decarboxylase subunit alpha [Paraburkholderia silvatlantica]MBB2930391.1 malonate decarboxylase alpha subunit [Paraburkholderia silvatlantica]PVY32221.1 malonate decarboxylase alpha subunit [Paraburkholderia silvatlantica]PXW37841.1 malonate decarboxylase alpha subunit [Paraburkholderia silvatlantica]PYE25662.1 malonate decarboxylase alpha subunit [Paraburkholderia silvatlantica]TDQ97695.1 malonate decarboxylase alpha subunit [Paraburkholderia silvatlantica]
MKPQADTPTSPDLAPRSWTTRRDEKARRLAAVSGWLEDGVLPASRMTDALELLIRPGDRVALEGDNQKQADFLSRALAKADPAKVNNVHLLISSISRPEHLTLFERGIAHRVDFAFAGPQSLRVAQLLEDGQLEVGAIHTYVELYARMFVDLIPQVALLCAEKADRHGNLYTGPNTEDTPTIAEAAAFSQGIVIVQVNEIVDELPRVDIPGSWVDVVVQADRPFAVEPLFTRDPRHIGDLQVLTAMMVIKGIYAPYGIAALNHGIGFDTAAIELLLPTYGESLGLKGKICRNWTLNPHPTLIPAIESGWVESVHCFGSEVGMEAYIAARPDVFFTGSDGSLRSNRVLCQLAGQYAVDLFIGSTLQIDADANSSTVTRGRLAGFGGAPNMGHDPRGRRHASEAWLKLLKDNGPVSRGHKLVVQLAETWKKGGEPTFVDELDAIAVGQKSGMPVAPVMIYGDDVSHVVTEEGIAHLHRAEGIDERRAALAAVAGVTPIGLRAQQQKTDELRRRGIVQFPEDLGILRGEAKRSLLAARSIDDLVTWSGGLYTPPARFRSW